MPAIKKELCGVRFERLVVLRRSEREKGARSAWVCQCDCGNIKEVLQSDLATGNTKSCGCYNLDRVKRGTHRKTGTHIYFTWVGMINRCTRSDTPAYKHYGARGIKVCDRWMEFSNFYADMGDPPPGMSLDRVNVGGDYEPSNCRWATLEQQANNKTNTVFVDGVPLSQWVRANGFLYSSVMYHRKKGRSFNEIQKRLKSACNKLD